MVLKKKKIKQYFNGMSWKRGKNLIYFSLFIISNNKYNILHMYNFEIYNIYKISFLIYYWFWFELEGGGGFETKS